MVGRVRYEDEPLVVDLDGPIADSAALDRAIEDLLDSQWAINRKHLTKNRDWSSECEVRIALVHALHDPSEVDTPLMGSDRHKSASRHRRRCSSVASHAGRPGQGRARLLHAGDVRYSVERRCARLSRLVTAVELVWRNDARIPMAQERSSACDIEPAINHPRLRPRESARPMESARLAH